MDTIRHRREVARLRELLRQARAAYRAAREAQLAGHKREKALRAENTQLKVRLHDAGVPITPESPAARRGYRTVDEEFRAQIRALNAQGLNNSQIARRLGCSQATASLVIRDKYPRSRVKTAAPVSP